MKEIKLTNSQKLAVQSSDKNILVSAGAGTGKTRVLVERFLNFVVMGHVPVTEILALTFTEKAANEMKKRIRDRLIELGQEADLRSLESSYISTIHSFALRVLKEHPLEAGIDPDFKVIEEEEMDFLQEQASGEVLELYCQKGNDMFELLRTYGENKIKDGILKVFRTARHEGKTLTEFFAASLSLRAPAPKEGGEAISDTIARLLRQPSGLPRNDSEEKLAVDFKRFEKIENWDWQAVNDFREWSKDFGRRGGKSNKETWREVSGLCKTILAGKIEIMAKPWKEKFEKTALLFEEAYEKKKKEEGVLDFDDLEILALRLFRKKDKMAAKILENYRQKFRHIMVDEFQDINPRQLELIEFLSRGDNLFFVGDYKQSIYAFRGAEAQLFLAKEKEYADGNHGQNIVLQDNFRTGEKVLQVINELFQNLWGENEEFSFEPLQAKTDEKKECKAEILLIKAKEDEDTDAGRMREADILAEKILELVEDQKIPFGDIAILFQAMSDTGIYEQALKRRGIPYYVISGRGFYHQPEIRDMISFLSFLENPLADIPLAASLRSPLFQLKDDTLFWMAHLAKEDDKRGDHTPLYQGLKRFEEIEEISEQEKEKIRFFLRTTSELAAVKDRLKLPEFLDLILAKTSYELTVLSGPQGVRKYANLKKLINLARQMEGTKPLSAADFVASVRRFETREVRESEAQIEAEASGSVVRLLSIHGSKGLEFPVVFIADLGRAKKHSDSKTILAQPGRGYALKVRNELTLELEEPLSWEMIDQAIECKEREEWQRLFYVALTRAENRLILSGVRKERKKEKESFHEMSSWMDWVMAMPQSCLEKLTIHEEDGSLPAGRRKQPIAERKILREIFSDFKPKPVESFIKSKSQQEKIENQAVQILARVTSQKRTPSRVIDLPVSAYALYQKDPLSYRRVYEIGYPNKSWGDAKESEWLDEENDMTAADFGTMVHRVLEKIDFKNPKIYFGEEMDFLKAFIQSPVFKKIQSAKAVYRELPFVLNERHGLIYGVLDLLFQDEQGGWHVLDYKTAVGSPEKVSESAYDLQIQIYALAVSRILGTAPKSGIIYFLKNQWQQTLAFDKKNLLDFGEKLRKMQEEILGFEAPYVL
ncbi:MAG: UvrD-helicase domain-containing protein [Candidatus Omnitrophica bacterium]|nr:UvrD-helicase domain-containing protein [Candidatus Omnitrophota bacterium]